MTGPHADQHDDRHRRRTRACPASRGGRAATAGAKETRMDHARIREWLDRYIEAWRTGDKELIGMLFAADARYSYGPCQEPVVGRSAIVGSCCPSRTDGARGTPTTARSPWTATSPSRPESRATRTGGRTATSSSARSTPADAAWSSASGSWSTPGTRGTERRPRRIGGRQWHRRDDDPQRTRPHRELDRGRAEIARVGTCGQRVGALDPHEA